MSIVFTLFLMLGISDCGTAQQYAGPSHRRIPYDAEAPPEHRIQVKIHVFRNGRLLWVDQLVTMPVLRDYLRYSRALNPTPYLILEYEEGIDSATLANLRRLFDEDGGCGEETVCSELRMPARIIPVGIR